MFWTRVISGIVLIGLTILSINGGKEVCLSVSFLISSIGIGELLRAFRKNEDRKHGAVTIICIAACLLYYIEIYFFELEYVWLFVTALLITFLLLLVIAYPRYKTAEIAEGFFAFFYVAIPISFIYMTGYTLEQNSSTVWLIFLCSWGADTCAYAVGMLTAHTIGNHKMTKRLSPKKSIEGAIGGVTGAFLLGLAYAAILNKSAGNELNTIYYGIICAAGALISIFGDLAASAIKREYNIKDYGNIIPGHGGIMDRFDSVIITAPIIFYLTQFIH